MTVPALPMRRLALAGVVAAYALCGLAVADARAEALHGTFPVFAPALAGSFPAPTTAMSRAYAAASPGQQCRQAIRAAERASGIPEQLMAAIGRIESGRREADGTINPWPWSINAEGEDHVYETKAAAVAAVRALQAHGMRSIDIGCMQVNLMHHPDAFPSLELAFDPVANANYAARFLVQLHEQTGAWPIATAWYHSATPILGADYQRKVMAVWPEEKMHKEDTTRTDLASAWAATRAAGSAVAPAAPSAAGVVLARRSEPGRVIPQPIGTIGRGLTAYRAMPIPTLLPLAGRPPTRPLLRVASNPS